MMKREQPLLNREEVGRLASGYENARPEDLLTFALTRFPRVSIGLAGVESAVLIDMAVKFRPDVNVFTIDTGRLHGETHRFIDAVRERYRVNIDVLFPENAAVEELVKKKGLFSFYADGHAECCGIRKVEPLRRVLSELDAWVTGQRRDSSVTRSKLPVIELDETFGETEPMLLKLNPLARWTMDDVWHYVKANKVPFNELYKRGFASIGCEPCTRAILPGEHERDGRWWWEAPGVKECGIHAQNLAPSSAQSLVKIAPQKTKSA